VCLSILMIDGRESPAVACKPWSICVGGVSDEFRYTREELSMC
jgi:hypothetical protein